MLKPTQCHMYDEARRRAGHQGGINKAGDTKSTKTVLVGRFVSPIRATRVPRNVHTRFPLVARQVRFCENHVLR